MSQTSNIQLVIYFCLPLGQFICIDQQVHLVPIWKQLKLKKSHYSNSFVTSHVQLVSYLLNSNLQSNSILKIRIVILPLLHSKGVRCMCSQWSGSVMCEVCPVQLSLHMIIRVKTEKQNCRLKHFLFLNRGYGSRKILLASSIYRKKM